MNRIQAEVLALAVRTYVEAAMAVAKAESPSPKLEAVARLSYERLEDAFVAASRHG